MTTYLNVSNATFGEGDGVTTVFSLSNKDGVPLLPGQLVAVSNVYIDGQVQLPGAYSVDYELGVVIFSAPPPMPRGETVWDGGFTTWDDGETIWDKQDANLSWDGSHISIFDFYGEATKYTDLIARQHASRPRFKTFVAAVTSSAIICQQALSAIQDGFDLDNAVGSQLDVLGLWAGVPRQIPEPIAGVYFTWGDAGNETSTGWSYGVWKGPYDPSSGIEQLPDGSYRTIIRARIAANQWDGTIPGAYGVWNTAFAALGAILIIQDFQNMHMMLGVASKALSGLDKAILTRGYLPIKPAGVRIDSYRFAPADGALFAWGVDNTTLNGWGAASWAQVFD